MPPETIPLQAAVIEGRLLVTVGGRGGAQSYYRIAPCDEVSESATWKLKSGSPPENCVHIPLENAERARSLSFHDATNNDFHCGLRLSQGGWISTGSKGVPLEKEVVVHVRTVMGETSVGSKDGPSPNSLRDVARLIVSPKSANDDVRSTQGVARSIASSDAVRLDELTKEVKSLSGDLQEVSRIGDEFETLSTRVEKLAGDGRQVDTVALNRLNERLDTLAAEFQAVAGQEGRNSSPAEDSTAVLRRVEKLAKDVDKVQNSIEKAAARTGSLEKNYLDLDEAVLELKEAPAAAGITGEQRSLGTEEQIAEIRRFTEGSTNELKEMREALEECLSRVTELEAGVSEIKQQIHDGGHATKETTEKLVERQLFAALSGVERYVLEKRQERGSRGLDDAERISGLMRSAARIARNVRTPGAESCATTLGEVANRLSPEIPEDGTGGLDSIGELSQRIAVAFVDSRAVTLDTVVDAIFSALVFSHSAGSSRDDELNRIVDSLVGAIGLEVIAPSRGSAFDPRLHRRVGRDSSAEMELTRNAVASVERPGIRRGEDVLRQALVRTA